MSLQQIIREQMKRQKNGTISYYDFMRLALYHPEKGYYSRPLQKIGKEGDFFTSASVGSIFGEILAGVFAEMASSFSKEKPRFLVEFGGGNGQLAHQILNEWRANDAEIAEQVEMIMIEKSPYHRRLQEEKLEGFNVRWFDDWESVRKQYGAINAVVYSNELFDAFPAYVLEFDGSDWREARVGWDEKSGQFAETLEDVVSPELKRYIHREQSHIPKLPGYRIEVNLDAEEWLRSINKGLGEGYIVTIDYGYERGDLYIPQRRDGTMMCYRGHVATTDPLEDPGEKDITTHVNFSALMDTGSAEGLDNLGLYSQRQFLINGGILGKLQDHSGNEQFQSAVAKRNRAIRQLIMPGGMGDTFQTLVQSKGNVKKDLESLKQKGWI